MKTRSVSSSICRAYLRHHWVGQNRDRPCYREKAILQSLLAWLSWPFFFLLRSYKIRTCNVEVKSKMDLFVCFTNLLQTALSFAWNEAEHICCCWYVQIPIYHSGSNLAHYGNIGNFGGLSSSSLCESEEDIGVGRIVQRSGCCMFHRVLWVRRVAKYRASLTRDHNRGNRVFNMHDRYLLGEKK